MDTTPEEQLTHFRIRPRFQIESLYSPEEVIQCINTALENDNSCKGNVIPGYATIYLPHEEQHLWSPQLSLSIEEMEEGSLIRGLYGPRPSLWTMFVFIYFVIGLATTFISIIGFSNYSLGQSATILWLLPILLIVFLSFYLVAHFGQKLGHDQMETLQTFIQKCLNEKEE